ncbi:hypothetical protein L1987_01571 [Smallanthus sonchifolius]|uniref:Uncharacterized protein n=1 Tax=Smallanthus sonchifolius TaxID=185202 RepID=A0ACB9K5N1_9ASTR|nr:hypothetical protein L1987_01571 [Smallanthus sonchifolius]
MTLGNLQLVSPYLTVLGNLALALPDTGQAREILRSSLTLAKKLYDIPTQIWVLSNFTALPDTGQAREILRSSLTLAKKLYDIPTQIWVLSNFTYIKVDEEKLPQPHDGFEDSTTIQNPVKRKNRAGQIAGSIAGLFVTVASIAIVTFYLWIRKEDKGEETEEVACDEDMKKDFEVEVEVDFRVL